jgi:hypothetical protein
VDTDFKDCPDLLAKARFGVPKMGNADLSVDGIAKTLLNFFADSW